MNFVTTDLYDLQTNVGREVIVTVWGDRKWHGVLEDVHHADVRVKLDTGGIVVCEWHTVLSVDVL